MAKSQKFNLHDGKMGAAITVRIGAKASRDEISEILPDGTIKIRLAVPAGDPQVNPALIRFLAEVLQVAPNMVEIIAGQSGRDKLITVLSIDSDRVQERIMKNING